jgi:hypothetical protein
MNTTTIINRPGRVVAILLGSTLLALAPITTHASIHAGAAPSAGYLPSGPDIAISAIGNLRQAIEADRGPAIVPEAPGPTLRQQIEADRAVEVPGDISAPTLRQLIESDRATDVSARTTAPTLRQLVEADRG